MITDLSKRSPRLPFAVYLTPPPGSGYEIEAWLTMVREWCVNHYGDSASPEFVYAEEGDRRGRWFNPRHSWGKLWLFSSHAEATEFMLRWK